MELGGGHGRDSPGGQAFCSLGKACGGPSRSRRPPTRSQRVGAGELLVAPLRPRVGLAPGAGGHGPDRVAREGREVALEGGIDDLEYVNGGPACCLHHPGDEAGRIRAREMPYPPQVVKGRGDFKGDFKGISVH